ALGGPATAGLAAALLPASLTDGVVSKATALSKTPTSTTPTGIASAAGSTARRTEAVLEKAKEVLEKNPGGAARPRWVAEAEARGSRTPAADVIRKLVHTALKDTSAYADGPNGRQSPTAGLAWVEPTRGTGWPVMSQ
ncbi:hypothetical protein HK405_002730, partial [Cladochytrium tenue]